MKILPQRYAERMNTLKWHKYFLHFSSRTDPGLRRKQNEDNLLVYPEVGLFCVADGAGGHGAGDIASELTNTSVSSVFRRAFMPIDDDSTVPLDIGILGEKDKPLLVQAIEYANKRVYSQNADQRMVSTIVGCHFLERTVIVAHVGDSRAYLIRNNSIFQLTDDHSLVYDLYKQGVLTEGEIPTHPRRNIITRAIGPGEEVSVSHNELTPEADDSILLCSDGLNSMVDDKTILEIVMERNSCEQRIAKLVLAANQAGGKDNISAILLDLREE